AVAWELGVAPEAIRAGLAGFEGIGRRLQRNGEVAIDGGDIVLVDDYGHHPTEIAATFEAVRSSWPERRLAVAFQPHRYSRTRDLFDDFARILAAGPDVLLVAEVYAAGEAPIAGADVRSLCRAIRARGGVDPVLVPDIQELPDALRAVIAPGDLVLTLGAGNIGAVARELPTALASAGTGGGGE
ncbi:MAG: cyanophycin synthetase, partial [Halofilum sp. (in: g-proteobacteria)]